MFKGVNFAAITAGFGLLSKSAIEYASSLQEVQNVVDVAFGAMANDINEWSKTTLKAFGLNELSSKRMAGRFMAMSNGMGIAAEKGLVMSKTLTQLSGDIASFYNVSVEEAETALQSIYTGETETLKRYGIVITEVNLQEYARRQGIQKSITQMTQLEKVMLRYNYIMEVTAQA
jgi:nucleoid DNA-binding protein